MSNGDMHQRDVLETFGRRCWLCRAPVAVRYDATGRLHHLDPTPAPGGHWQLDPHTGDCRRHATPGPVRYHAHADTCRARLLTGTQGMCRGHDCRTVVTLYGPGARLLCDDCNAARTSTTPAPDQEDITKKRSP